MTVKQDIKMFLDNLSVRDKVEVLKELYKDIAGLGIEGDTQLAHINTFEANLLIKSGGSGTLHPVTGLPQYKGGGGGTPQATFQNTNQFSRIPEEVAPFAEDVLTEAQDYYRMIMNQGYDPYTGAVIAPQTVEQEEAQAGLAALGRGAQGTALQQEALDLQRQQGERFTPEVAQEYMSPYQRAVTDIEKRKAVEDFEQRIMPQFEAQAVRAGGMSGLGSRAGVQASLLGEGLQQRLGDIEAKGLQSAFLNAQQQFQDQKRREAAQAQQTAALGPAMFSQGLAQQGALQTVGEQRQNVAQQALDEQYYKYLEQKAFPEEQLAKYSGFVYGNPLLAQRDVTSTATAGRNVNQPSTGAQLLGTGLAAANTFRQIAPQTFGSFTSAINPFKGGGGLSDIIYRDNGGEVIDFTTAPFVPRSERRRAMRDKVFDPEVDRERELKAQYDPKVAGKRMSELARTDIGKGTDSEIVQLQRLVRRGDAIPAQQKRLENLIQIREAGRKGYLSTDDTGLAGTGAYTGPGEYTGGMEGTDLPVDRWNLKKLAEQAAGAEGYAIGTGGVDAEAYSLADTGERYKFNPRFDEVTQRNLAEERERRRTGFYDKTDKERREFNRRMADRRRAERERDYQRRRELVGEADPIGTLLSQLSQSLLRTRDFDETTGIGARLAEGLTKTTSKLSEADKERREKLLEIEDQFGRRQAEESEREFEAEGQLLSRTEERKALALAREFKLEDKIMDLPFAKQRKALELINAGLKGEKLKAEIEKLRAEARAEGSLTLDATTAKALDDTFKDQLTQVIPNALSMDGVPMNATVAKMINAAKEKAQEAYIRGGEDATAARRSFQESLEAIRGAMKTNPKYFEK